MSSHSSQRGHLHPHNERDALRDTLISSRIHWLTERDFKSCLQDVDNNVWVGTVSTELWLRFSALEERKRLKLKCSLSVSHSSLHCSDFIQNSKWTQCDCKNHLSCMSSAAWITYPNKGRPLWSLTTLTQTKCRTIKPDLNGIMIAALRGERSLSESNT